jgi:hypothetical protein
MTALLTTSGNRRILRCCSLVLIVGVVAACATIDIPLKSDRHSDSVVVKACVDWFTQLDEAIDRAGVRDAGAYRIPGFPYLRVDRFSASFGDEVKDDPQAFDAWVARLQALDANAHGYEFRNLPRRFLVPLTVKDNLEAEAQIALCGTRLATEDLRSATQRDLLIARAKVPDDYAGWKRVLGLYPLARIPFSRGIEGWEKRTVARFRNARTGVATADTVTRYEAPASAPSAERVSAIFARIKTDAIGIPRFGSEDRETLFRAYAPAYEVETSAGYDRFGSLAWSSNPAPDVDVSHPVVYRRLAYTRYHRQTLVQLVYTIWFPERPRDSERDLLAGKLDGLVFRVTLDAAGRPLVYDAIHPCGCYHMFFPTVRVKALPAPEPRIEWAFIPMTLPALDAAERVAIRIESRTHYVVDLRPGSGSTGAMTYRFAEDEDLRALPTVDGATRSAFGPDGIVPGTERGERLWFWPMGIYSSGAMRQWGRHATAFIGRRHFDDADLIERRFRLLSADEAASNSLEP